MTATVQPAADTYAVENAPDANFGTSSRLAVRGSKGASSYLRFTVPTTPAGRTLTSATLVLQTASGAKSGSRASAAVSPVASGWAEPTLTWNKRPALSGKKLGTIPAGTRANTVYRVPLRLAAVISAQGASLDLAITSRSGDILRLWSSGHGHQGSRPQLVLTYR